MSKHKLAAPPAQKRNKDSPNEECDLPASNPETVGLYYSMDSFLSRGGFGEVMVGRDLRDDSEVVIKLVITLPTSVPF